MKKLFERIAKAFVRHMFETINNKICALVLILIGLVPVIASGDVTALLFNCGFALPLILARTNWIEF